MEIALGGEHGKGLKAIVDSQFYDRLRRFNWSLIGNGYPRTWLTCPHGSGDILMHQMVMNLSYDCTDICLCDRSYTMLGLQIDHINSNKLDNQLSNLLYTTEAYNNSKQGSRANQSSQYNGVCWGKQIKKWRAYIKMNGKKKHIGYFDDEIEAAHAHDAACREHGLDRMLNFPKIQ